MSDEPSTRAHERVGDVLNDKWTLERLLGVGGMGAVYAGRHRNGARAAVKVLHRYLACHDDVRARFLREGHAANRVDHPSVVKVLDDDTVLAGPDVGTAYLVMELLEGESLEARSRREALLSEREFLQVAEVVLEVLDVAHRAGVVHRDIKPDNIFITKDGAGADRVKVLDFGLARLLEGHSTTVHGLAVGTPSFMAPEQAGGRNDEIDGRTDLFALAATGLRLVTGRRVHEGANAVELVVQMANTPAPRLRTVAPEVSEAFARVMDRALEFRREDRYESAAAMRVDVQSALAVVASSTPSGPAPAAAPAEKTIELMAGDLEADATKQPAPLPEEPADEPAAADTGPEPEPPPPPPPARGPSPPPPPREESIATPLNRRAPLPLVLGGLALALVGAGAVYASWGTGSDQAPELSSTAPPAALTQLQPAAVDSSDADAVSDATAPPEPDAAMAVSDASVRTVRRTQPRRPTVPWKATKRPKR